MKVRVGDLTGKIYISSPFCGEWNGDEKNNPNLRRNIDYAKEIVNRLIEVDTEHNISDIIAPHLYYTQFTISRERGRELAMTRLLECDVMLLCVKYGISEGMWAEVAFAKKNNIRVYAVINKDGILNEAL